jgi:hypothetical protein
MHRRLSFKVSNLKFALFFENELQCMDVNISYSARNMCARAETTSGIFFGLGGFSLT